MGGMKKPKWHEGEDAVEVALPAGKSRERKGKWFDMGESAFASTHPLASLGNPELLRALRFLLVVRSLHDAGYQRMRISAGMSPSGLHWRCYIGTADNVETDGWSIVDSYSDVVGTSFGNDTGNRLFEWEDVGGKSAGQSARMFVERFPEMARRGLGHDEAYADWFAGMMATANTGRLPVFFADYNIDLSEVSVPRPPKQKHLQSRSKR